MNVSDMLINQIINGITNLVLFTSIPLVWYIFKNHTSIGFFKSVGLFIPAKINYIKIISTILPVYLITLFMNILVIELGYSGRSNIDIENFTFFTLLIYLLVYGVTTGIWEEIFFRGFIGKKLINKLGFAKGNTIQAIVFALPHFVINNTASTLDLIIRIINAFLLGFVFGHIMHNNSKGSIVPVIILHMVINMVSSFIMTIIL